MNMKNKAIRVGAWFKKQWKENQLFSTGIALILMVVLQTIALGFQYNTFGQWFSAWFGNWINILRNNAGIGIISLGMAFVIITGGIDLAVGSTYVVVGAFVMALIDSGPNGLLGKIGITGIPAYAIGILGGLLMGLLVGEFTGIIISKGKMPPFIATLGMMMIGRSVTQHIMQRYVGMSVPSGFQKMANFSIGGYRFLPIIYWGIIAVIMHRISTRTVFGRQIYAVGSNARTSQLSGINVEQIKRRVYALMGVLVAISSILHVSRMGSMDYSNSGAGYEMDAIAAVIVGGVSMSGGRGSIIGSVFGMLIIAVMNNLLNLWGVPPLLREAFKGVIVISAVLLQKKEEE